VSEKKVCEQCHAEKDIEEFRKHANKYVPSHRMSICKVCYKQNQEERQRQYEARMEEQKRQEEAVREAERQEREQEEQWRRARALELSLQANKRCPRCKRVRTDGQLWGEDHLHFTKYCQECTEATPHAIYTLTCPLDGLVRYVGITCRPLNKRLTEHMKSERGSEQKSQWIEKLREKGIRVHIEKIDEAPNELEALQKEVEWCEYYIRQGQPLANVYPPFSAQDILDLQSGRICLEEQRRQELEEATSQCSFFCTCPLHEESRLLREERAHLYESSSGFRIECSRTRQGYITRWKNRQEHAYVADTSYSPLNQVGSWFYNEKATLYEHVTCEHALPKDRTERQAFLDTITRAFLRWDEAYASSFTNAMREDIHFLWKKQVPIICQHRDSSGASVEGYVVQVVRQNKRYTPIIHPFSHRVDPSRALACLPPSHCGHPHCVGQCIIQRRARFDAQFCELPVPAALPSQMSQDALF
jgi:hypothetical protein